MCTGSRVWARRRRRRPINPDALLDLRACIDLDAKPTLCYGHALDVSSYMGADDERELVDLAAQADPGNIVVRLKYMDALEPRWGGSYERMEAFLEESRRANLAPEKLHLQMALAESQPGDTARDGQ
jgi:hypothetical protein